MSNKFLPNPITGTRSFGTIPEKVLHGWSIRRGAIRLLRGVHYPLGSGFGLVHIWSRHSTELRKAGFPTLSAVPAFVGNIIRLGMPIHFNADGCRKRLRLSILNPVLGSAILEWRGQDEGDFYSVVTAYPGRVGNGVSAGIVG